MLKEIEEFNSIQMEESPDKVDILCAMCRGRVGYVIPAECELPLLGSMVHHHPGCNDWQMPLPMSGAIDFICPHAVDPEFGDQHLFVEVIEGKYDETNWFLDGNCKPYRIGKVSGKCPCGCGGNVVEGNKYTDNLRCYRRHVAQLKAEIEDGARDS